MYKGVGGSLCRFDLTFLKYPMKCHFHGIFKNGGQKGAQQAHDVESTLTSSTLNQC